MSSQLLVLPKAKSEAEIMACYCLRAMEPVSKHKKSRNISIMTHRSNDTNLTDLDELRKQVTDIMQLIRSRTPRLTFPHNEAKASEIWEGNLDGKAIERIIIYLRSRGCFWALKLGSASHEFLAGCLDCEHSVAETTFGTAVSAESYFEQFMMEYKKYDFSKYPMLCLYNEGNFFNEDELPINARNSILQCIADNPHIKTLVLECIPQFITRKNLEETKKILGEKHVEIAIGLESSNPVIRTICVNKPFNLKQFEIVADLVNEYFTLLSYVLIKPSFLTEAEALEDAINTVRYAYSVGTKVVSLEPVSIGQNTMSGALHQLGLYRTAWLWTVIEIAKTAHEIGEVRIGGYQFAPKYNYHAENCEVCTSRVKHLIRDYNSSYDISILENADCECKSKWQYELAEQQPPLLKRVPFLIEKLREVYSEKM
jgi:hypothetical protein